MVTKTGVHDAAPEIPLGEALQRLESICRRLWDADSPAAIDLQAVIEEFSGAVRRSEQATAVLRQRHAELEETAQKEAARAVRDATGELSRSLRSVEGRLAAAEAALAAKESRVQSLLAELAAKEAQNLEFHETYLKNAAEQDEARAQRMDAFYRQLSAKESGLESRWEQRRAALEAEHKARVEGFKKRQDELLAEIGARAAALDEHYLKVGREVESEREKLRKDREAWEAAQASEGRALSQRKAELATQAEGLAAECQRKRAELQKIKDSMQAELARVVADYQAKQRRPA